MAPLHLIDNLIQDYHFVCALTEQQKRQAYTLRYQDSKAIYPNMTNVEQVIDQYDTQSLHLLLQNKASQQSIAAIRLTEAKAPNKPSQLPSKHYSRQQIWIGERALAEQEDKAYSEISRLCLEPVANTELISDIMYLGALSLARLLFHDFILMELPVFEFKRLRSLGLRLEQTRVCIEDQDRALFWVSTEQGINSESRLYDLYQHILGDIAYQMNQPELVSESAVDATYR